MNSKLLIALLMLILTFSACKNHNRKTDNFSVPTLPDTSTNRDTVVLHQSKEVSVINLIATPEKYNGKQLRIIGYLHLEFEGNVLYLHEDDYENAIDKNGIWVEFSMKHSEISDLRKFSNHYVILEGTFDSKMRGHGDANSGSIKNIKRLEIWPQSK